MSKEFKGEIFFFPSELFTNLEDPASRERFKWLMQFQYGFLDEESERYIDNARKEAYWEKVAPEFLALVINKENERAFQVGELRGYLSGKFIVTFGDLWLKRLKEDEILLIRKCDISPMAGIRVRFLDDNWQETLQEGTLIGYEKVEDRKQGDPFGWYIVNVGEKTQRIADWREAGSDIRFFLQFPSDN